MKIVRRITLGDDGKRAAYRKRRRAQVQEWSARLDLWQARVRRTRAEVEISCRERVEDLRDALASAGNRIVEMERAGEEAWNGLREGVDTGAAAAKEVAGRVARRRER